MFFRRQISSLSWSSRKKTAVKVRHVHTFQENKKNTRVYGELVQSPKSEISLLTDGDIQGSTYEFTTSSAASRRNPTLCHKIRRSLSIPTHETEITFPCKKSKSLLSCSAAVEYLRDSCGNGEYRNNEVNLNSSLNAVDEDFTKNKNGDSVKFNFEDEPVKIFSADICSHCAAQGYDLTAREARIHPTLFEHDVMSTNEKPFRSISKSMCEFPFTYSYFLGGTRECNNETVAELPKLILSSPNEMPEGTRIRIRLNDHLRGEEGVRGWLLIIEARVIEALFAAVEVVHSSLPHWRIWEAGEFNRQ
ncbi:hypothetical protein FBUS_04242 [Fasciolopsis buskii]|uniref:Uncharacterized protein n=1 Tax=Fasciolopsis buskii TaxID=27845 RepID=A0A8E0VMI6_9TREM|nr:hypothetical protein FBUS_04242 [Fasciolopsis buski]